MVESYLQNAVRVLKETGALQYSVIPFKLRGGGESNWYLELTRVLGNPDIEDIIVRPVARKISMSKTVDFKSIDAIAAKGYGGVLLAKGLSRIYRKNVVMVRDKPKPYGGSLLTEGDQLKKGDTVIGVDDILTTKGTAKEIVDVVRGEGGDVRGVYVFLDRTNENDDFRERAKKIDLDVPVDSFLKMDELISAYQTLDKQLAGPV